MKNLYFNVDTLNGTSENDLSIILPVEDDFNLSKVINIPNGTTQKVNENGEKLYLKEVYRKEVGTSFVCNEETTEVTDKPLMQLVQKTDSNGELLFLEEIELENGDLDTFETTKKENELGEPNEPIMIEVQKCTSKGLPIYIKTIMQDFEYEVLDRTEETTDETDKPIMIPTFARSLVNLEKNCEHFTYDEVVSEYEKYLSEKEGKEVRLLVQINENSSVANTGLNILNLPPKGYVTFTRISLNEEANVIEIPDMQDGLKYYVNSKLVSESSVELANAVKNVTVKIANPTSVSVDIQPIKIHAQTV